MTQTSSHVILPSTTAFSRAATYTRWTLCVIITVAILLAPAIWNGFAIVFFDTGGYIERVLEMALAPGRSFFYGLFLWAASFGWWSFWGPALLQSIATLWTIHVILRCHDLPAGPLLTTLFCIGLALSTGIAWYTSQLMPDILVPLMVLALWLLGFRWEKLRPTERALLMAVALLGMMSHMASMALAIGLVTVIVIAKLTATRCRWPLSVRSLPPIAVVIASVILMPVLHLALTGKASYTPGGPNFIFGRFVQDGIAQRWLAEHCPAPGVKLCTLQDRLPKTADDFLWGSSSPFQDLGGWGGADSELSRLVTECVKAYPVMVAWTSLRDAAQQLTMTATGDGLDEYHDATRGVFAALSPDVTQQFNAARQQQKEITRSLFDNLNRIHVPVAHVSMLCLLLVIGWGIRARRPDLAGLAMFTLLALLGNAFICGALSNPHDRYQSRIVWLATLVVAMTIVTWWTSRHRKAHLEFPS